LAEVNKPDSVNGNHLSCLNVAAQV